MRTRMGPCRDCGSRAVIVDCVETFATLCKNLFRSARRVGLHGLVAVTTSDAVCDILKSELVMGEGNFCVNQNHLFSIATAHVDSGDHCAGKVNAARVGRGYYSKAHGHLAVLMVCTHAHLRNMHVRVFACISHVTTCATQAPTHTFEAACFAALLVTFGQASVCVRVMHADALLTVAWQLTRSFIWLELTRQGITIVVLDADMAFVRNPFKEHVIDPDSFILELSYAGACLHSRAASSCAPLNVLSARITILRKKYMLSHFARHVPVFDHLHFGSQHAKSNCCFRRSRQTCALFQDSASGATQTSTLSQIHMAAGIKSGKFLDAVNNRCRGSYPTALRALDGKVRACAAIPPPYFATPASTWWFERHTYMAVECQADIQTETLRDLDQFYPTFLLAQPNSTLSSASPSPPPPSQLSIVNDGQDEYHGHLNMSNFEPISPSCENDLRSDKLRMRVLPMNSFVTKCSHKAPIDLSAETTAMLIAAHANCAVWRGTVENRVDDKINWLNMSRLWFLDD
jgi:hypothetical protein